MFIDARNLGHMIDRKVRELSEEDIKLIASTYQNWRQGKEYEDEKGFKWKKSYSWSSGS